MLEFTNKGRIKKKGHMTNPEPGNERKIANCPWLSMLISSCWQLWFCRGIFYHPGKQNINSDVCLQDERETLSLEKQLCFPCWPFHWGTAGYTRKSVPCAGEKWYQLFLQRYGLTRGVTGAGGDIRAVMGLRWLHLTQRCWKQPKIRAYFMGFFLYPIWKSIFVPVSCAFPLLLIA